MEDSLQHPQIKYSHEAKQTKQILMITIDENGLEEVEAIALKPLHEMRKLKGSLRELMENNFYRDTYGMDYIQAVLTDKGELIDAMGTLRNAYPNMMQIVREDILKAETEEFSETAGRRNLAEAKDTNALFAAFYREVRGEELGEEGRGIIAELIKEMEA